MPVARMNRAPCEKLRTLRTPKAMVRPAAPSDASHGARRAPGGAPVVSDGRVFVTSLDHHVYALDAGTGQRVWDRDLGAAAAGTPTIESNIIANNTASQAGGGASIADEHGAVRVVTPEAPLGRALLDAFADHDVVGRTHAELDITDEAAVAATVADLMEHLDS